MKFSLLLLGIGGVASQSIDSLEHVVIFMQENRAFDHYIGKLKGIRGFNDRATVPLSNGHDAFHQPTNTSDLSEYMLPFRAEKNRTAAMCMPAPEMYYPTDIKIFNEGKMDAWNTARDGGVGMSYFERDDMPYYFELYSGFTTFDQYYQSTFTCTCPNRLHLFSGSNGLSAGWKDGAILDNTEPTPGFDWETMGETLDKAGVSWQVFQEEDNFDDNGFAWFDNFMTADKDSDLYQKGMKRQLSALNAFDEAVKKDALPQVSWVIAPTSFSEHATNHPCAGEFWTSTLLQSLKDTPEVYKKTAFILNYDEGGQFYDHAWTPTPPMPNTEGKSTVTTDGEVNEDVLLPYEGVPQPIGLGFRVPGLIVSPWTRGDIVVSEIYDHTSTIQFLEKKFNLEPNPNISPWRRAMTGDMMAAFDFANPDYSWPDLPDTSEYVKEGDVECETLPDVVVPTEQSMPQQEPGTKIYRAIPYETTVHGDVKDGNFELTIDNTGAGGLPFVLFDLTDMDGFTPRNYAVEGGKSLSDTIPLPEGERYAFLLHSVNGFVREFTGVTKGGSADGLGLSFELNADTNKVVVKADASKLANDVVIDIIDNAYGLGAAQISLKKGEADQLEIDVSASSNWYDFTVGVGDDVTDRGDGTGLRPSMGASADVARRFMGRLENGKDGTSDPAMAAGVRSMWEDEKVEGFKHVDTPHHMRTVKRGSGNKHDTKDSLHYDEFGLEL